MNKRQRKKQDNKIMKNDIIYLKLYLHEDEIERYDRYNVEIKCRGFSKFFRKAMELGKKYHINVGYYNPDAEKRSDEYFKNKYGDCDE